MFYLFQAKELPGIKVFRYESSLFFANAENFGNALVELTGIDPSKLNTRKPKKAVKFHWIPSFSIPTIEEVTSLNSEAIGGESREGLALTKRSSPSQPNGVRIVKFVLRPLCFAFMFLELICLSIKYYSPYRTIIPCQFISYVLYYLPSSLVIYYDSLSSTIIPCHISIVPYYLFRSFTIIYYYSFTFTIIRYYLPSFLVIYYHSLSSTILHSHLL